MAFIRQKQTRRGTPVYYVVENRRVDGRVRQRVVAYLGRETTLGDAIAAMEKRIGWSLRALERIRARRGRGSRKSTWREVKERKIRREESLLLRYRAKLAKLQGVVPTIIGAQRKLAPLQT